MRGTRRPRHRGLSRISGALRRRFWPGGLGGGGPREGAASVVVATGARYRRLGVPNLGDFEGRGVWYWASPIEARLCRDEEIVLVGGGNSGGPAPAFLRTFSEKIWKAGG